MTIRWSDEALKKLQSLHDFVAAENPLAAQKPGMLIAIFIETHLPYRLQAGRPGRTNGTRELLVADTP